MIEILKEIEKEIGIDIIINFLTFISGIGIGAGITDAIHTWEGDKSEAKKDRQRRDKVELRRVKLFGKTHGYRRRGSGNPIRKINTCDIEHEVQTEKRV